MGNRNGNFPWLTWLTSLCIVSLFGMLALERGTLSSPIDRAPVVSQSARPSASVDTSDPSRPNDASVAFPAQNDDEATPPPSF